MSEARILELLYHLEIDDAIDFKNSPPLECDLGRFSLRLDDERVFVTPKESYYSVEDARALVEPVLKAWEIDVTLSHGLHKFRFVFDGANRKLDDTPAHQMRLIEKIRLDDHFSAHVSYSQYPEPPRNLLATPDVETLWYRYQGYREGREPLLAMSYFCLTVLERLAGGRPEASKLYAISYKVLDRLGKLTTIRGNPKTGRKYVENKPLSVQEKSWIEAVIEAMIRQLATHEAGQELKQVTMADMPDIT